MPDPQIGAPPPFHRHSCALVLPQQISIEWVVRGLVPIRLGRDLDAEAPSRVVAALDRVEQVTLVAFAVVAVDRDAGGGRDDALFLHCSLRITLAACGIAISVRFRRRPAR
jgi:hypothetical protein